MLCINVFTSFKSYGHVWNVSQVWCRGPWFLSCVHFHRHSDSFIVLVSTELLTIVNAHVIYFTTISVKQPKFQPNFVFFKESSLCFDNAGKVIFSWACCIPHRQQPHPEGDYDARLTQEHALNTRPTSRCSSFDRGMLRDIHSRLKQETWHR